MLEISKKGLIYRLYWYGIKFEALFAGYITEAKDLCTYIKKVILGIITCILIPILINIGLALLYVPICYFFFDIDFLDVLNSTVSNGFIDYIAITVIVLSIAIYVFVIAMLITSLILYILYTLDTIFNSSIYIKDIKTISKSIKDKYCLLIKFKD